MEKLSLMIEERVENKSWQPMRVDKKGPLISHLKFVDDLLLFAESSPSQMVEILDCLNLFCQPSGQAINHQKTLIYFSKKSPSELQGEYSSVM